MIRRGPVLLAMALILLALPAMAQGFGLAPGTTKVTALNSNGTVDTQAGSHPGSFSLHFELKLGPDGRTEGGEMRSAVVDLPPGFVGNPSTTAKCPRQDLRGGPNCPLNTQVGVLRAIVDPVGEIIGPVFNMVPPPGVAAEFGFNSLGFSSIQYATVLSDDDYRISVSAPNLPLEARFVTETIWGTPADPSHDAQRGPGALNGGPPASSEAARLPYLTLPAACGVPLETRIEVESKLNLGVFEGESAPFLDAGGNPAPMTGCEAVPFSPSVSAGPSTNAAGSSSGLDFELDLPNQGLLDGGSNTETEPEKTEVTLPPGVSVNPAAAGGQGVCTLEQYEHATAESLPDQGCPESAKVGTLLAKTPLLEEAIEGSVYLAAPHDNPFHSLLALYIVARAPERGILIKQAGEVHADPVTGQLTTTFDGLPPVPYSSFELDLREGPRAPLITPQTCGTYVTQAKLYPFSAPGSPVEKVAPFTISTGADGGACASSEAHLPNHPTLEAGTVSPFAGAYSPFIFKISRADGSQRLSAIEATLPPGLVGKLAGVPYCSEAAIAAAMARNKEGEGALELASPSCPAASQVGIANVGAGAGSQPYYVQGKAYLAGPYKGAPLSLAIITPAIAGPFDLGVVVVRTALFIDESSAQIHAVSDPLPTIIAGIPLDVRSVSLQMNKPNFTLNPTSCELKAVTGTATSTTGSVAALTNRFKVGGCGDLGFAPKLKISLKGGTKRSGHPALKAVVTYPQGGEYANIARASVALPHAEFLDQGNLDNVCTQPQLKTQTCPAKSIYGRAKAWSPLLDQPLEGNVYLGVGFGHLLPDLVAELGGQIRIRLHGKVDTDSEDGIRNTFEAVPDAPVSKFILEMQGGKKKGLLENSEDICLKTQKATVVFTAQNGKVARFKSPISTSCGGKKGKSSKLRSLLARLSW